MTVEVKLFDDFDAVAADADGALDREHQPSLFDRLDWFRLVAAYCPPPGALLVARARSDAGKAWLFLTVDRGHARALACWYSFRTGLVMHGGLAPELGVAIAQALSRHRIATVELYPLAFDSLLPRAFADAGWLAHARAASVNWRSHVGDMDFAGWWHTRPARLRHTAVRKARAAGLDIRIHRHFDATAWADYETVYAASWKPPEGSPAFVRAMAEGEAAAGTLRLGVARQGERPIAAQLWLVENGIAAIHKLAHVRDADALSPGTILSMAMMRAAIDEDRVTGIDYGTGDDGYKADWMDERVPLLRLVARNPRMAAGIAGAARDRVAALVRRRASD